MSGLFGWFDVVAVAILGLGIWTGRRRGMSSELLQLVMWAGIIGLGGFFHGTVGRWLARSTGLGPTVCYVTAYLMIAGLMWGLVALARQQLGEKIVSGDAFGGYEYYLGMVAGLLRAACIVVFVLALMHAPRLNRSELDKQIKAQKENLGSIYFPPFGQIQLDIQEHSIAGRVAEQHLQFLLVTVDASAGGPSKEGIGRRREREVNEIMGK